MDQVVLRPVEFVALVNQTLEYAFPYIVVEGEIAHFRISKNRWVYFDLKDDEASVKCFGTVYQLPGPLEDGMLVKVSGTPRLHQQFGFSMTVQSMLPSGEGSIKKAAALLEKKLEKEGLFAVSRKRVLPYPPEKIGLITSGQSAAYADFIKILNARWQGITILHKDVQVQGEVAPAQIVQAIELFNMHPEHEVDVLVITRGGGSADDLAAFNTEQVARAVAASRIPTLVAIGHEVDTSLAERTADKRASTPSNAAELLVPDMSEQLAALKRSERELRRGLQEFMKDARIFADETRKHLNKSIISLVETHRRAFQQACKLLQAYSPSHVLARGFAVVRQDGNVIKRAHSLKRNQTISIQFTDGSFTAAPKKGVE